LCDSGLLGWSDHKGRLGRGARDPFAGAADAKSGGDFGLGLPLDERGAPNQLDDAETAFLSFRFSGTF
jgi:hypothetical protein